MTLLINKNDFIPYAHLSTNLDTTQKLDMHIAHAQDFDLRPLLGDLLYYDILAKLSDGNYTGYKELLTGGSYSYKGVSVLFKGITPVLVHFTLSRLVPAMSNSITPTTFAQKRNEFSDPVAPAEIARVSNMYKSLALGYWAQVEDYLDRHKDDFSLWKNGCGSENKIRQSGAKIYGLGLNKKINFSFRDGRFKR